MSREYAGTIPLTLANKITLARIAGIPLFVASVLVCLDRGASWMSPVIPQRCPAVIFFTVFALDALDGFAARVRGERTRFGAILDPLADKLLVMAALVLLAGPAQATYAIVMPFWFALLVIARDVYLLAGAVVIHALTGNIEIQPRFSGKAAALLCVLTIGWVLWEFYSIVFQWLLAAAAAMIIVSTAQYTIDGWRQIRRMQKKMV